MRRVGAVDLDGLRGCVRASCLGLNRHTEHTQREDGFQGATYFQGLRHGCLTLLDEATIQGTAVLHRTAGLKS